MTSDSSTSLTHRTVDQLTEQVGVTVVAGVLLDHGIRIQRRSTVENAGSFR